MESKRGRAAVLAAAIFCCATASAQAFEAHGSAEQAWATGLSPGGKVTLTDSHGRRVATQNAGKLGGVLFRDVSPGRLPPECGFAAVRRLHRFHQPVGAAEHRHL